ncbi:hypothetical protein V4F39_14760 [Aquincola sp. MAHUQ-54]|uniref:Peroxidase n=2 Tax=Sphaerotilaceae TaxID=2975441 RepID=A0AAW9QDC0_9BURK
MPEGRASRADARLQPLLRDLQGNILRGHGRERCALILLRFHCAPREARRWVSAFGGWVETAAVQFAGGNAYELPGAAPFWGFYLSAAGYRHLGVPQALQPADPAFQAGMRAAAQRLGDPSPDTWDADLQHELHAMVLLAHAEAPRLQQEQARLVASLDGIAHWSVEQGQAHQRKHRDGLLPAYRFVEHFGFADGRSQPLFFEEDLAEDLEGAAAHVHHDPSAPLSLVLAPDAAGGAQAFGSYLVWRKLEQDVRGFHRALRALAQTHPDARGDAARAGALMVGRYPDGSPLQPPGAADTGRPGEVNDFDFSGDAEGRHCPFSAHIRRINPRDGQGRDERIVRRGISYGTVPQTFDELAAAPLEALPEGGVGLQFMCFQSAIGMQFERLQQRANVQAEGDGPDAIAGTAAGGSLRWPAGPAGFQSFVTLKGGEYFHAPARSVLTRMVHLPG